MRVQRKKPRKREYVSLGYNPYNGAAVIDDP
jgi:hypothetical protein